MSAENIAELDAIAAEAGAFEAGNVGTEGQPVAQPGPVVDPAEEWRQAAHMGCGLVIAMRPELSSKWTPEKLDNLGNALAQCAERYGWTVGALLGHPLVALAFAVFPLGASLVEVEKARKVKEAEKPQAAAQEVVQGGGMFTGRDIAGNLEPAT